MSTPEDTFNALKKWPFREAAELAISLHRIDNKFYYEIDETSYSRDLIHTRTHWILKELVFEMRKAGYYI